MGILSGIGDFLGTNSSYQATPYQADRRAYQWQGPSQGQLGGYLQAAQGQSDQDRANQLAARGQEMGYLSQLQNAANGNGPSQAQGVLQQGANQAAAQAISLARSGGGNPAQQAAAMRAAQQTGAAGITSAGAQAAQIKAQEQQNALNQMGGAIQGMRAADLSSQGMGNAAAGQYLGAQMGAANAQLGADMSRDQLNAQSYNAAQGLNQQTAAQNAQSNQQMLGGLAGMAGGALMMSDMRVKTDIAPAGASPLAGMAVAGPGAPTSGQLSDAQSTVAQANADSRAKQMMGRQTFLQGLSMISDEREKTDAHRTLADGFLEHLRPFEYRYRDPGNEPRDEPTGGRYLGVMAQDVERAPGVGRQIVSDTPRGKAIELPAMVSALGAGVGRLHERIAALEAARSPGRKGGA